MQLTTDRFEGDHAVLRTNAEQDPAVQSEGLHTRQDNFELRSEEYGQVRSCTAGQELVVPRSELPTQTREGDVLTVSFATDAPATNERAQRAKEMLNEILGGTNNESPANPTNTPNRTNS